MLTEPIRKIIHIDMDAFYASVEQRDNPSLRGKPVIVGGLPNSRGVVATCSYEAREYGIHSAMPSSVAQKLCPHAIFIKTDIEKYRRVSRQVMEIFRSCTDLVEPLSLDEAYLDVTQNKWGMNIATDVAREIKRRIASELHLTASAGVSYNKFLAKVGSGYQKPDGLVVIPPGKAQEFIDRLPIGKFFGVGEVTEKKFLSLGIETGADLRALSLEELTRLMGKRGAILYENARGIDHRPVVVNRPRKSIGKETTLSQDIYDRDDMLAIIEHLSEKVSQNLIARQQVAYRVTLKVKYSDFKQVSKSITLDEPIQDTSSLFGQAAELLNLIDLEGKGVRLLGVTTSRLRHMNEETESGPKYVQLTLF